MSNSVGMIGSILYAIGAVAFVKFLLEQKDKLEQSVDKAWLNLYIASLGLGCVSFMYFHIAVGGMIHHFKVLYEVTGPVCRAGALDKKLKFYTMGRIYNIQKS